MALTLYSDSFFISPYAFSAFVALEEKGVPYTLATLSLPDGQHRQAEYKAHAFIDRVPAIVIIGRSLVQSPTHTVSEIEIP